MLIVNYGYGPHQVAHWFREGQYEISKLRTLNEQSCTLQGFMKFTRAPVYGDENLKYEFHDARFSMNGRGNFASVEIDHLPPNTPAATCPDLPPWLPPREDLLANKP